MARKMDLPRSDVVAAMVRGLPGPTEPEEGKFVYTNCLFDPEREYDDTKFCVKAVDFAVSRYSQHEHRIIFGNPTTEARAIRAAEAYLSEPLTEEYYDVIKDDLFFDNEPWEKAQKRYVCRGDALTDLKFLEVCEMKDGILTLVCGS